MRRRKKYSLSFSGLVRCFFSFSQTIIPHICGDKSAKPTIMPKENTQFKGKGVGITHKQKPVSVMLPFEIDAVVRSLPNRSDYIRKAIAEKLEKDGFISA